MRYKCIAMTGEANRRDTYINTTGGGTVLHKQCWLWVIALVQMYTPHSQVRTPLSPLQTHKTHAWQHLALTRHPQPIEKTGIQPDGSTLTRCVWRTAVGYLFKCIRVPNSWRHAQALTTSPNALGGKPRGQGSSPGAGHGPGCLPICNCSSQSSCDDHDCDDGFRRRGRNLERPGAQA